MRHIQAIALIVALAGHRAAAQELAPAAFPPADDGAPRQSGKTAREAEARRRRIDFIEASAFRTTADYLTRYRSLGETVLTSGDRKTTYLLVRRTMTSVPEVHARWDDIVIVRSGTGAIAMGDSLVGSTLRGIGDRVGGKFTKRYEIVVHAGDLVRIPATVPHAFIVSGTEPLEYLVIKQRRPELPARWTDK